MLWVDIRQIHKATSKSRGKTLTETDIKIALCIQGEHGIMN